MKKTVKTGFWIVTMGTLSAWAAALIYGIYTDQGNVLRYGLKLMMIAGIFIWYFDSNDPGETAPKE